ncbi:hypothetical protein [Terriglobus albidus]|uniref:hypothetical protein n=1 Tax=Terriglobus albidus TaxID=1592106 RepID=UPI0021E065DF|nr:hypothetical protein [Terriglobus albidus]
MNAIDSLLSGLIDYAGLYPPAGLDMQPAVRNYLAYKRNRRSELLGRFIVDWSRLSELREIAGDSLADLPLSVVASSAADMSNIAKFREDGFRVESVEIKPDKLDEIDLRAGRTMPETIIYFEVPVTPLKTEVLDSIRKVGGRVKIRTGGVTAGAFPLPEAIAAMLTAMASRGLVFKATAGLHHPIRGCHPFTYEPESQTGIMHGFLNLFLAAMDIYFGGTEDRAQQILKEEDPEAFRMTADTIEWRSLQWSTEQLRTVRREFAIGFGSCSFVEPIQALEGMGWL